MGQSFAPFQQRGIAAHACHEAPRSLRRAITWRQLRRGPSKLHTYFVHTAQDTMQALGRTALQSSFGQRDGILLQWSFVSCGCQAVASSPRPVTGEERRTDGLHSLELHEIFRSTGAAFCAPVEAATAPVTALMLLIATTATAATTTTTSCCCS